jgi:hypothetical protein
MTFYAFRQFSPVMQLYWVLKHGPFLAQRWEDGDTATHATDGIIFFGLVAAEALFIGPQSRKSPI